MSKTTRNPLQHPAFADYLNRLELALSGADAVSRASVIEGVRNHFLEAVEGVYPESDLAAELIVQRIGPIEAIVGSFATPEVGINRGRARAGTLEVVLAALGLVLVPVMPFAAVPIALLGLVWLWLSTSRRGVMDSLWKLALGLNVATLVCTTALAATLLAVDSSELIVSDLATLSSIR